MGSWLSVSGLESSVWCHSALSLSPDLAYSVISYIREAIDAGLAYIDNVFGQRRVERIDANRVSIWNSRHDSVMLTLRCK
jgi:hypothetical protein